ncbi:MAG TPA: hypothetical protein RMH99_24665 [Sandaracinaceae bacterium LLY-WYZ-13_1]|nr:hypothetical protein [Sandaracinaceae bacterium LLY-WYZ-13_1]
MSRFWAGFAVATALWVAGAAYLYFVAGFGPPPEEPSEAIAEAPEAPEEAAAEEEEARPRRRRGRRRRARRRRQQTPSGTATVGDDLGEDEMRSLDMEGSGGEQQLSPRQIEAGFDGAMGSIRRCLVLMPGGDPVTGRLTFGLRVAGSGEVTRVRLSGPRAATTGEAGTCLQRAARQIRFDSFDGPEMVVRYPITLE